MTDTLWSNDRAMVDHALNGDSRFMDRLLRAVATDGADHGRSDAVLNHLGDAAVHDERARLLLLEVILRCGLARTAIAQVIIEPDQIDDVEQLVFLAVERGIGGFAGRSRFRTWLFRVARNEALMHVRRLAASDRLADRAMQQVIPSTHRVSSVIANRDAIEAALNSLPPLYRDVVRLRAIEQLSYREMAVELDIELNTVRSRLFKARKLLDDALAGDT